MERVIYPGPLEHFWREQARAIWGYLPEDVLLERVRPHVQALSDRFTTERASSAGDYGEDPASRLAYGLFFFPQTFARTQLVLQECWRPPADGPVRILDLGAGTGAAGLAALYQLGERPAHLHAVDRSVGALEALQQAAAACRELWPGAELEIRPSDMSDVSDVSEPHDLILCSFALNERAERDPSFDVAAWLRQLLGRLAPKGLLAIVEPALKICAERLEVLRDRVAAEGWGRIIGPCLHRGPCPMRAEGRFWCHEVRRWAPPPLAEKINRTLFRDLPNLKFSFLALSNASRDEGVPAPSDSTRARLVAPVTEQRGKFITRACGADGRLRDLELLTRRLDADARAVLRDLERGSRIQVQPERELGNGALRVRSLQLLPLTE